MHLQTKEAAQTPARVALDARWPSVATVYNATEHGAYPLQTAVPHAARHKPVCCYGASVHERLAAREKQPALFG